MEYLILVDDHKMLRTGIISYISEHSSWKVLAEAECFSEIPLVLQKVKDSVQKDDKVVAVVDLQLKDDAKSETNGFDVVKIFKENAIPSIIYSAYDNGVKIEYALGEKIGAMGFVSKNADEKILLEAINAVSSGKKYIQQDLFSRFLEVRTNLSLLTKREKEVLNFLDQNFSNEQIAKKMNIKQNTVENYISVIYDKLGCKDRNSLIEKLNSWNGHWGSRNDR